MQATDNREAVAMCVSLHHVGIVVSNLEEAVAFYAALAGFEKVRETAWTSDNTHFNQVVGLEKSAARLCLLKGANCYLELFEFSAPVSHADPGNLRANDYGIRHLCFEVDDVAATLGKIVSLGGAEINEPLANESGTTAVYCRDPFGNLLELVAPSTAGPFPSLRSDSGRTK